MGDWARIWICWRKGDRKIRAEANEKQTSGPAISIGETKE